MIDLEGVEIQVWRPKPRPDKRVMKLERGGPLPGGCYLCTLTGWHWNENEEFVYDEHEEVWFQDENYHFSIEWSRWVILDEENNARGYLNWDEDAYERIA